MKILDRLGGGSAAADLRSNAPAKGEALSFRARMKRLAPVKSASWKQLLRLNRQQQVDPWIGPPTPPPGFSIADPASERNLIRRLLDNRNDAPDASEPIDEARRQSVDRMLSLLWEQQQAHDELSARSVRAAAKWR